MNESEITVTELDDVVLDVVAGGNQPISEICNLGCPCDSLWSCLA